MKDLFGREITYLRLSVTESCNLRCRYCMPEECAKNKQKEAARTEKASRTDRIFTTEETPLEKEALLKEGRAQEKEALLKEGRAQEKEALPREGRAQEEEALLEEETSRKREAFLTEDEMIRAVEAAASLGIYKLRITGGEPLIRSDILSICRRVSKVPGIKEVSMTTNALLLEDKAEALYEAGVSRLNISLDTLDPVKYTWITRTGSLEKAIAGIEAALAAGFEKVKINVVLIGGFNEDEIPDLAGLTRRWPVDVRFIELMPMPGSIEFEENAYIPCTRVLEKLPEAVQISADFSAGSEGVAKLYHLPGAHGHIGLISPVNEPFCSSCSRLRLTADGKIRPCLHSGLEFSVRGLDTAQMVEQFKAAIRAKPEWHGGLSLSDRCVTDRCMNQIGG